MYFISLLLACWDEPLSNYGDAFCNTTNEGVWLTPLDIYDFQTEPLHDLGCSFWSMFTNKEESPHLAYDVIMTHTLTKILKNQVSVNNVIYSVAVLQLSPPSPRPSPIPRHTESESESKSEFSTNRVQVRVLDIRVRVPSPSNRTILCM